MEGFIIITCIYFLGQIISKALPVPLPGNIIGLILMVAGLAIGIIPLHRVEEFASLLLDNLILVFIPLNVSIVTIWPILRAEGLGIFLTNIITTIIVLVITGLTVNMFVREGEDGNVESNNK